MPWFWWPNAMRLNSTLILALPSRAPDHWQVYECDKMEGMIQELDFIPPELRGQEQLFYYAIEDYVADLMLLPGYRIDPQMALADFRKDGITHIAVLSMPNSDPATMRLAHNVFQLGYIVYYCAAHNRYRLLHCENCAATIRSWMDDMQNEWGSLYAVGGAVQKKGPPYH